MSQLPGSEWNSSTRYPQQRLNPVDVPKEPFAYMGTHRTIKSPLGAIILAAILLFMTAWVVILLLVDSAATSNPGLVVLAIAMLLVLGGPSTALMVIGVKRLRWLHSYIRVTGQRPWA